MSEALSHSALIAKYLALFDTNIEYRVSHKQPSCIPLVLKNSLAFGHVGIPGDNAKQISPRFLPRGMRESLCGILLMQSQRERQITKRTLRKTSPWNCSNASFGLPVVRSNQLSQVASSIGCRGSRVGFGIGKFEFAC